MGGFSGVPATERRRQTYRSNHGVAAVQSAAQRVAEYARSGRRQGSLVEDGRPESITDGTLGSRHASVPEPYSGGPFPNRNPPKRPEKLTAKALPRDQAR